MRRLVRLTGALLALLLGALFSMFVMIELLTKGQLTTKPHAGGPMDLIASTVIVFLAAWLLYTGVREACGCSPKRD